MTLDHVECVGSQILTGDIPNRSRTIRLLMAFDSADPESFALTENVKNAIF